MSQIGYFLRYIFLRFESNENRKNASSLTFVTLFALVPLMTVGYGLLKVFPQFAGVSDQLQDFVFAHFVPTSGDVVKEYLQGFSDQASKLTWLGILTLCASAFTLLLTIENALNRVWRVTEKRSGIGRFLLYWTMLSLGPFLLGLGFLFSSYLISLPIWFDAPATSVVVQFLPYIFGTLALTLMYTIVPGCKVELKHALAGAAIAAALLEVGKFIFIWGVSSFPSYQLVYGAFAAIPLFLLWIYVAWCIVLLGAELVRALAFAKKERGGIKATDLDWTLELLRQASISQESGKPLYRKDLVEQLPLENADQWEPLLEELTLKGWLVQSADDGYVLLKDLHTTPLSGLSDMIHQQHIAQIGVEWRQSPWHERLAPVFYHVLIEKKAALAIPIHDVIFTSNAMSNKQQGN